MHLWFQINSKGDLKIRDLTWNDRGNYMCRVKNHNGSQNVTSFLYPVSDVMYRICLSKLIAQ